MLTKALFPGSFDPITIGHVALIERALCLVDRLVVVIAASRAKQAYFSVTDRHAMVSAALASLSRVEVVVCEGLLVDCAREQNATAVIRGVRSGSDCDYECQMARVNRQLSPELETLLLPADPSVASISSTLVRELLHHQADVSAFVPGAVLSLLPRGTHGTENH